MGTYLYINPESFSVISSFCGLILSLLTPGLDLTSFFWQGRIIYNKSTRYDNMLSQEELEEQQQMLLRRQIKTASKVSETKARIYETDVDFSV